MQRKNFKVATAQSHIDWIGRKVTGSHKGTINIREGLVVTSNSRLIAGKFIIDTTSIKVLDVTDPATNAQLAGHLASDDFFASEKYPEAILELTSAELNEHGIYDIEGDLTIKGITHPVIFGALLSITGDRLIASGKIIIDRTLYEMKFRSGNFFKDLGDVLIYDDFELNVSIVAEAIPVDSLQKQNEKQ